MFASAFLPPFAVMTLGSYDFKVIVAREVFLVKRVIKKIAARVCKKSNVHRIAKKAMCCRITATRLMGAEFLDISAVPVYNFTKPGSN